MILDSVTPSFTKTGQGCHEYCIKLLILHSQCGTQIPQRLYRQCPGCHMSAHVSVCLYISKHIPKLKYFKPKKSTSNIFSPFLEDETVQQISQA